MLTVQSKWWARWKPNVCISLYRILGYVWTWSSWPPGFVCASVTVSSGKWGCSQQSFSVSFQRVSYFFHFYKPQYVCTNGFTYPSSRSWAQMVSSLNKLSFDSAGWFLYRQGLSSLTKQDRTPMRRLRQSARADPLGGYQSLPGPGNLVTLATWRPGEPLIRRDWQLEFPAKTQKHRLVKLKCDDDSWLGPWPLSYSHLW